MKRIFNGFPHTRAFQSIVETDDGEVVAEKLRLEPGEVRRIEEATLEQLMESDSFQKAVDQGDIVVEGEGDAVQRLADDAKLRNLRENVAHQARSEKFVDRLTAKAADLESVAEDEARRAQAGLEGL